MTFCFADFAKVAFVPLMTVVAVVTHAQPVQSSAIEGREILALLSIVADVLVATILNQLFF